MTQSLADKVCHAAKEVERLGEQIERHRAEAEAALLGQIVKLPRSYDVRIKIDRVTIEHGGMHTLRLWARGPVLKANGEPHARQRDSVVLR